MCVFNPVYWLSQILESTQEDHADRRPLREALERAEELCSQVNEGVREKENSDRLEWIQSHVQCEGVTEVDTHTVYPHTQYLSHVCNPPSLSRAELGV